MPVGRIKCQSVTIINIRLVKSINYQQVITSVSTIVITSMVKILMSMVNIVITSMKKIVIYIEFLSFCFY